MTVSVPLGILDRSVPSGSHICAFYSGSAGRDEGGDQARQGQFGVVGGGDVGRT
jgi:hypothetical protein